MMQVKVGWPRVVKLWMKVDNHLQLSDKTSECMISELEVLFDSRKLEGIADDSFTHTLSAFMICLAQDPHLIMQEMYA